MALKRLPPLSLVTGQLSFLRHNSVVSKSAGVPAKPIRRCKVITGTVRDAVKSEDGPPALRQSPSTIHGLYDAPNSNAGAASMGEVNSESEGPQEGFAFKKYGVSTPGHHDNNGEEPQENIFSFRKHTVSAPKYKSFLLTTAEEMDAPLLDLGYKDLLKTLEGADHLKRMGRESRYPWISSLRKDFIPFILRTQVKRNKLRDELRATPGQVTRQLDEWLFEEEEKQTTRMLARERWESVRLQTRQPLLRTRAARRAYNRRLRAGRDRRIARIFAYSKQRRPVSEKIIVRRVRGSPAEGRKEQAQRPESKGKD